MNKAEFISFIASENDCSKAEAERALNMIVEGFMSAISKKQSVNLVGFGSFAVQSRKAREGRNPKTGAKMNIPAYNQPVFKAGKKLKDVCN